VIPIAQVMLTKNMPEHGLVNGSRGVVSGFQARLRVAGIAHGTAEVAVATWSIL